MAQSPRPELRAFYVVTFAVVGTYGALMFIAPGATSTYWAWIIASNNSSYLVGSAYLAAAAYYLMALRRNDWSLARSGTGGLIVFSLVLLVATMLHWDRFRPYHPTTLIWMTIYYVPPFGLPILYRLQNMGLEPPVGGRRLARPWRIWVVARGAGYALLALIGFVFADQVSRLWPWPADPLDIRVFTGQLALNAWAAYGARKDHFAWRPQRLGFLLLASLGFWQLAGIFLGRATYHWDAQLGLVLPLVFVEWFGTGAVLLWRYGWRDEVDDASHPAMRSVQ